MRKLKVIIPCIIVFIIATIVGVHIILNGDDILVKFNIESITNVDTDYTISYSGVKAADYYKIQIHDSNNIKIYEGTTKKNNITVSLPNLLYDEEYSVMVFAYDKLGDYRPADEPYSFKFEEPSFDIETLLLNNKDYDLNIKGNLNKKEYKLIIKSDDSIIKEEILKENVYKISSEFYKDKETKLDLSILDNKNVISTLTLYNNMNPISDLIITTPISESIINYNDFTLSYDGGDNASSYVIKIYNDKNKCIKTSTTSRKKVIISKNIFSVGESYRIEVIGKYEDYEKSAFVNITMMDKEQLKPVFISNNWRYLKKGTQIELMTHNEDNLEEGEEVTILYTLDGKDPESFGVIYKEPITINENVKLRAMAISNLKYSSIVTEYDINIAPKEKLVVYLSPSNQYGNLGVSSVGYTNERDEMNDLTNYIEERLKSNGVIVYRNSPAGNINQWNKDSNYLGADLKIAIHSNASTNHDNYGIETWIDTENSKTLSLASLIQKNLVRIYPYNTLEGADRGVKYAGGALGEANDNYIPFGILVEIAHHDNKNDAEWMMKYKKQIGYNIADSILEYYQFKE